MPWHFYLFAIGILGVLFFAAALYALWWSSRKGHFERMDQQSKMIFDDEEPMGRQTDFFPGEESKGRRILGETDEKPTKNTAS